MAIITCRYSPIVEFILPFLWLDSTYFIRGGDAKSTFNIKEINTQLSTCMKVGESISCECGSCS